MPIQVLAKILEKKEIAKEHFKFTLSTSYISSNSIPGQFVLVRCRKFSDPLLRRPMSIHKIDNKNNTIDLLFKVKGFGTRMLSELEVNDNMDIFGPLGNGFKVNSSKEIAIIVSGGYGIAPMLALGYALKDKVKAVYSFIGANTKELVLCEEEFRNLGIETLITTDDGSYGRKGLVTDELVDFISSNVKSFMFPVTAIFACGPHEMLKRIAEISLRYKISTQISVEEKMACGIGACLGCPIKTKSGYKMVCKDGPIFDTQEIVW